MRTVANYSKRSLLASCPRRPVKLYQLRAYPEPQAKHCRVPAPSYTFTVDGVCNALHGSARNCFLAASDQFAWLELIASHTARTAVTHAAKEVRDQVPPLAKPGFLYRLLGG